MLFLPITLMLVFFSIFMFIHIARSWNAETKTFYTRLNEIIYALLTLSFGLYYPFLILRLGKDYPGILFTTAVEEFSFLGNLLIGGVMLGIFAWALSAKIRTIRNPKLLESQNNYEVFCEEFLKEYPKKSKLKRKITHILPVAVVTLCVLIFYFFTFLDGAWIDYALFFVIILGIDFALTFLLQDLIRLYDFSWMPPNAIRMCAAGLTPEELDTFTSTSVMVFSFGPFMFFSFPIFYIVILITAVADAFASIFGIIADQKGFKHIFPKWSDKSIEGYVGGSIFTFLCVVIGVVVSNLLGLSNWHFELILIVGVVLSIEFFLIDLITTKIKLQDNYLNPFILGFTTVGIALLSNVAIF